MPKDILELTAEYASEDQSRWGRLASDITFRRLEILLLSEILAELRELNSTKTTPTSGA